MREETLNWWKQANYDLSAAKKNVEINEYYVACFLSQQSAEKALKTLYIEKFKELPPSTHNLKKLGEMLNVQDEIMDALIELNPNYVVGRYPNAANGVPAEQYNKRIADTNVICAEKVIDWVKKELEK